VATTTEHSDRKLRHRHIVIAGREQVAGATSTAVIAGHGRPKDGVASLAYARKRRDPAIHERVQQRQS
jgi:hypothetical protein